MPPSWNTWMLNLEGLSPALLLFKFSLVCTDLQGVKGDWAQCHLRQAETLATSLWFSLLILCSTERTWMGSDVQTYWTNYKATSIKKSCLNKNFRPVFCHAPLQRPVHCRNTLSRSPILCSNMTVYFLLVYFFLLLVHKKFAPKLLWMSLVLWEEPQYTPNFLMISIIY